MVVQKGELNKLPTSPASTLGDRREEEALSGWLGNLTPQCRKFRVELSVKIFGETYESNAAKLGYKDACKLINIGASGKIEIEDGISIAESFVKAVVEGNVMFISTMN